jgi:dTDP-4-amino-4,6-dideoxygalactose transaminase
MLHHSNELSVPFLNLKTQYDSIRDEILDAIQRVLESAHFVGGEWVEEFEDAFARYVGARYAIAVGNGTDALQLVLRAWRIGPGDEVIVPANSFFATAEAVSNVGATPVFADVEPQSCHLDSDSAERCITPRTRAIIPVHLYGRAMEMKEIVGLAERKGLAILEDACQAHGARDRGIRVGGAGRPACFSFYPGKNLGAYGDGGAITCDDARLAETLRMLRDHGSPAKYHHAVVGTNSRLDSLQAAVLSVKLRSLDEWNRKRALHAAEYLRGFSRLPAIEGPGLIPPAPAAPSSHNFHLFVMRATERTQLRSFLAERGIESGIHYPTPLHLTPAYRAQGYPGVGSCPVAERLAREVLSLPMFPELTAEQIHRVTATIEEYANRQNDRVPSTHRTQVQTAVA